MQNPAPVQTAKSSTGLDENVAALLSYVFGWISGLIFFLIEKESRLVRFHAMQSLLLNVAGAIIGIALWFLSLISWIVLAQISGIISFIVSMLVGLVAMVLGIGLLIGVIICLIKAYQGQYFKLPVIGNMAEKFSAK
ncbi:MAG TPA: DUF4870 domain-containing protein [Pyrinomonadaceae bacterium]|nr:DUF4870 domain-containing protein [Pyrinomonadaceae bacterium]